MQKQWRLYLNYFLVRICLFYKWKANIKHISLGAQLSLFTCAEKCSVCVLHCIANSTRCSHVNRKAQCTYSTHIKLRARARAREWENLLNPNRIRIPSNHRFDTKPPLATLSLSISLSNVRSLVLFSVNKTETIAIEREGNTEWNRDREKTKTETKCTQAEMYTNQFYYLFKLMR